MKQHNFTSGKDKKQLDPDVMRYVKIGVGGILVSSYCTVSFKVFR